MNEKIASTPIEKLNNQQRELKQRLLSGELSVTQFLEKVFELDQKTPSRDESTNNVDLLNDPEVAHKMNDDEDAQFEYYNLLSLSHFHIGQSLIMKNPSAALPAFEAALASAEKIEEKSYEDWKNYIQATIAYLKKDIPRLEQAYSKLEEGTNKQIIGNMLPGLRENGDIDYERDYRS